MEAPIAQEQSKTRRMIPAAVTVAVLLLIGLFAWRVSFYLTEIQRGGIDVSGLTFNEITLSQRIASLPVVQVGDIQVSSEGQPSLGSEDAAVEIVEFADFGCPYSRQSSFTMRALARSYGDQVHYAYRDFPLTELHPEAQQAAEAGECAREQGKFWEMHDKMYQNQSDLSIDRLVQFARELNLNERTFARCLEGGKYKQEVLQDYQDGINAGVRGTPTFFINGHRIPGNIPQDVLEAIVDQFLAANASI